MINCQSDDYGKSDLLIDESSSAYSLIMKNSLDFVREVEGSTRSSHKIISSVYPWCLSEINPATRATICDEGSPDTLLYIVNFGNNEGYTLVNACSPYKEVLAYVEQGNMYPQSNIENPGLNIFLDGLTALYQSPMDSLFHPFVPDTSQFVPNPYAPNNYWYNIRNVTPLIHSTWGQNSPFNKYIEPDWNISCGVVAFGQILSKFKYPTLFNYHVYDWDEICSGSVPASETGEDMASHLLSDILSSTVYIRNPIYMQYGHDSLSRFAPCWNYFNYSWQYGNYNFEQCMNSLEDNSPVMISGVNLNNMTAHIWVIDGGKQRCFGEISTWPDGSPMYIIERQYKLVHCNWGWYGQGNGYFLSDAFNIQFVGDGEINTNSHAYNSYPMMFYNIHPNNE